MIQNILRSFKSYRIFIIGDLNSRCSTPATTTYTYLQNPDRVINSYGRKLLQLCKNNDMVLVNGLMLGSKYFDSNFTFHRGKVRSQNDWCLSNSVECIREFRILSKQNYVRSYPTQSGDKYHRWNFT